MKVLLQNVLLILAAMLLALLAACKDNPTGSNDFTVTVSVANLPRLAEGQGYYRLWISFPEKTQLAKPGHGDEDYVSFGAFNVSTDGKKLECLCGNPKVFEPAQEVDINLAADALITIETEGDLSEEPGARLVGGVFTGNDRTATAQLEARRPGGPVIGVVPATVRRVVQQPRCSGWSPNPERCRSFPQALSQLNTQISTPDSQLPTLNSRLSTLNLFFLTSR